MATNNPINIPIPFSTVAGGTGVNGLDLADNGIMVSHLAAPMTSIVLNDNEVLVGVTGSAPVPTTLAGLNQWQWEEVISPPGNTVNMERFHMYCTRNPVNRITFVVPSSPDVFPGDQFIVTSADTNTRGFVVTGNGLDRFWQGQVDDGTSANGTTLTTPNLVNAVRSIWIVCFDNANPLAAQYLVLNQEGNISMSG